jgi:hypothetical protein
LRCLLSASSSCHHLRRRASVHPPKLRQYFLRVLRRGRRFQRRPARTESSCCRQHPCRLPSGSKSVRRGATRAAFRSSATRASRLMPGHTVRARRRGSVQVPLGRRRSFRNTGCRRLIRATLPATLGGSRPKRAGLSHAAGSRGPSLRWESAPRRSDGKTRAHLARSVGERDHHLVVEEPELLFEIGEAVDPSP